MTDHFQRFTAPDASALAREIAQTRGALSKAQAAEDPLAVVDLAGDLASMLTTDRREAEARDLLAPLQSLAREHLAEESAGWFFLAFGTASQYLGLRAEANVMFTQAFELAQAQGWERLEHFVLMHWGRSLVEEGRLVRARQCFVQSLAIRERLNDPRASSTRRALDALGELESSAS